MPCRGEKVAIRPRGRAPVQCYTPAVAGRALVLGGGDGIAWLGPEEQRATEPLQR